MRDFEARKLTKKEERELRKQFPKIPKRKRLKDIWLAIKNYNLAVNLLDLYAKENKEKQEEIESLQSHIKYVNEDNGILINKLKQAEESKRKLVSKTGGLTTKNNSLKKEVDELNEKLNEKEKEIAELKSERYLIKRLPAGKKPKSEPMKLRGKDAKVSNVTRKEYQGRYEG